MMDMIMKLLSNWHIIVVAIAIIAAAVVGIKKFVSLPTDKQIAKVKECLLAWVIEAERELGGGTGSVKLSTVYGMFVTAFPFLKNFVSLETFSEWVDESLEEMRNMLETNKQLNSIVNGSVLIEGIKDNTDDTPQ